MGAGPDGGSRGRVEARYTAWMLKHTPPTAARATSRWQSNLVPAPDVLKERLGDDLVLLRLATETYYGLNAVGARVWELLEQTGSAKDAVAALCAEFDVLESRARADVERLVDDLLDAGLLIESAPPEAPSLRGRSSMG